ncbi:MAG: ABC transporter ATP-binding protein [Thermoleophilia bacterium]
MSGVALEASGLVRAYDGRRVVDVENMVVGEGQVVAVLGPNGAGKSTLFRMLALLENPDEGTVSYFGSPVTARDTAARRRVASVFQRPYLFQGKVRSNVAYGLRVRRMPRSEVKSRVASALSLTAIEHLADAEVKTLSGGEAQRVALARALVVEPSILFLDEPTSNLDVDVRQRLRRDLKTIVERLGTTVVLITHDRSEAFSLAQKVVLMRDGRIVQQGDVDEVYSQPKDAFVAGVMGAGTIWRGSVVRSSDGLCSVRVGDGLMVEAVAASEVGDGVALAIRPEDVAIARVEDGEALRVTSVRNRWLGVVESINIAGPLADIWIDLDGAGAKHASLRALVTRPSVEELALAPGVRVEASVKATAVHLLDDTQDG